LFSEKTSIYQMSGTFSNVTDGSGAVKGL